MVLGVESGHVHVLHRVGGVVGQRGGYGHSSISRNVDTSHRNSL